MAVRLTRRIPAAGIVAGIVLGAWAFIAFYGLGTRGWFVQTDELQYVRLALSAGDGQVGQIHGQGTGGFTQLFSLVLAPLYWAFSVPTAFKVAHALTALMLASAAVPAYLLAREVVSSRVAAYVVAACSAFVPWAGLALALWTESLAYPIFLWAVLALLRAVVSPSLARDAVAFVAVALAFTTRTQFLVLALAFPVAIIGHEVGFAVCRRQAGRLAAMGTGLKAAVTGHKLLAVVVALTLLVAAVGGLGTLLGPYRGTVGQAPLLPDGIWNVGLAHWSILGVAAGTVPMLLVLAWWPAVLLRPPSAAAHAFAVLSVVVTVLLFVQASSFIVNYAGGLPNDRYVFYVLPLLLVGAAAFLVDGPRHWAWVVGATVLFAFVVPRTSFGPEVLLQRSPAASLNPFFNGQVGRVRDALGTDSLTTGTVIRWAVVAVGIVIAVAVARWPRRLPVAVGGVMVVWALLATGYALPAMRDDQGGTRPDDWVDRAAGTDAQVALAPSRATFSSSPPAEVRNVDAWWGVEFWNKSVRRTYQYGTSTPYTPFPVRPLTVDTEGRLLGSDLPRYLVQSARRVDLGVRGRTLARHGPLRLVDLGPRPRVSFSTTGMVLGGTAIRPGGAALVQTYGARGATSVSVELAVPPPLRSRQQFFVSAGGKRLAAGTLRPGRPRRVRVCLPPGQRKLSVFSGRAEVGYLGELSGLIVRRLTVRAAGRACGRSRPPSATGG